MDSYSFEINKLKNKWGQKDMGQQLVSKPDVMSVFCVVYPYVCKKNFNKIHQTFNN